MAILPEPAFGRFVKLCGMLGSNCETERAMAAHRATTLLREHGLTWGDAVGGGQQSTHPKRNEATAYDVIRWCHERLEFITSGWEADFVLNLYDLTERFGKNTFLTPKRWDVLLRIHERLKKIQAKQAERASHG